MTYRLHQRRPGFTLIELMVAATLSLVIMTIMALAFQSAMGTLSTLKSMGDQADRLRTAEVMLRADLDADHIVGDDAGSTINVSDLRFDDPSKGPTTIKAGFFGIKTATSIDEKIDSDSVPSTRSAGATNELNMTVKRSSRTPNDLFGYNKGAAAYKVTDTLGTSLDGSQWAQVTWKLGVKTLTFNGVDMYPLHRIVTPINGSPTPTSFTQNPAGTGDDIVLTNVVSFEVKPLVFNTVGPTAKGVDDPYSDTSWNSNPAPNTRCVAVLVKVRLYDVKTKLTRQMSLIVKI